MFDINSKIIEIKKIPNMNAHAPTFKIKSKILLRTLNRDVIELIGPALLLGPSPVRSKVK